MVEIIPKPAAKLPLWQNILFYLSLAILLATILSYFILDLSIKASLKTLQDLEEVLAKEKTPAEISLEREIFSWQRKIEDFSKLIKNHLFTSNFFIFFEKVCHPKVSFSKISLIAGQNQASLAGQAENFSVLQQQIIILRNQTEIKNLNLSDISIGKEGKVDFTLNLSLNPNIFK